jgi:hypothetical protein
MPEFPVYREPDVKERAIDWRPGQSGYILNRSGGVLDMRRGKHCSWITRRALDTDDKFAYLLEFQLDALEDAGKLQDLMPNWWVEKDQMLALCAADDGPRIPPIDIKMPLQELWCARVIRAVS